MTDNPQTTRPITEREKLIFAYIEGFESGNSTKREWTKAQVIKKAAWKADRILNNGSIQVWDDGNTFPPPNFSAPPDILDFSHPFLSRGRHEA